MEAAARGSIGDAPGMGADALPTPTLEQLEAVRKQQLELASLHAQMEPVLAMTFPPVDNEEATAQLFERNAAQFAAREKALKELMNGLTQLGKDASKLFTDGEQRPPSSGKAG